MPSLRRFSILASALSTDAREAATLARQADFAGLLFDAFTSALNISDLSITGRREFKHVLSAQDRELVGLRVDLGPKGFGPGSDVDRLLFQLQKVLESAAGLNAPLLCIELGPLPEPPRETKPKPKVTPGMAGLILLPTFSTEAPAETKTPEPTPLDTAFASHVDGALIELGVLADRFNVTVAFRSDLASFAALERAIQAARCPWFGIDLDPVAMLRDIWTSQEIFSRLGPLIHHVRTRDATVGADRRTKPAAIGQGSVNWNELLSDIEDAAYHGWFTIDPMEFPDRSAAAIAGLKYLKSGDW